MNSNLIKNLGFYLLLSTSTAVFAQQPTLDVADKSAAYLESLRSAGGAKKENSKAVPVDSKEKRNTDTTAVALKVDQNSTKKVVIAKNAPKLKKGPPSVKTKAEEADSKAYVSSQQNEGMIAVYPELTAIYSKGGAYFVVLKLGSRTITAQDGESTICGIVKVLNLNSAKIGSQVLNVN